MHGENQMRTLPLIHDQRSPKRGTYLNFWEMTHLEPVLPVKIIRVSLCWVSPYILLSWVLGYCCRAARHPCHCLSGVLGRLHLLCAHNVHTAVSHPCDPLLLDAVAIWCQLCLILVLMWTRSSWTNDGQGAPDTTDWHWDGASHHGVRLHIVNAKLQTRN